MQNKDESEMILNFSKEFSYLFKHFTTEEHYGICLIALVPEYQEAIRAYNGNVDSKQLFDILFPVFLTVASKRGICGAHLRVIQCLSKKLFNDKNAWKSMFESSHEWRSAASKATELQKEIAATTNNLPAFYGEFHTPTQNIKRNQSLAIEIIESARSAGKWTPEMIREFCSLANIESQLDFSDRESVKQTVNKAAEILNVRIQ